MSVLDAAGNTVALDCQYANEDHRTVLRAIVAGADLWSSEHPALYTLVLTLKNNGAPIEYISTKFGFRKVEILDGVIRINDRRVVFKGTNRHEFDCRTGRYITEEALRAKLENICTLKNFKCIILNSIKKSNETLQKGLFFAGNSFRLQQFAAHNDAHHRGHHQPAGPAGAALW